MKVNVSEIRVIMGKNRITQTELAKRCGVARPTICTVLAKGTCMPITAAKMAEGLGVDFCRIAAGVNGSD